MFNCSLQVIPFSLSFTGEERELLVEQLPTFMANLWCYRIWGTSGSDKVFP